MNPKLSTLKPWQRMGITRRQYFTTKPWKKAKMTRAKYERLISLVPQEYLDEIRISAEAEVLVESMLGQDLNDESN
jgi:hypothetical protein